MKCIEILCGTTFLICTKCKTYHYDICPDLLGGTFVICCNSIGYIVLKAFPVSGRKMSVHWLVLPALAAFSFQLLVVFYLLRGIVHHLCKKMKVLAFQ